MLYDSLLPLGVKAAPINPFNKSSIGIALIDWIYRKFVWMLPNMIHGPIWRWNKQTDGIPSEEYDCRQNVYSFICRLYSSSTMYLRISVNSNGFPVKMAQE